MGKKITPMEFVNYIDSIIKNRKDECFDVIKEVLKKVDRNTYIKIATPIFYEFNKTSRDSNFFQDNTSRTLPDLIFEGTLESVCYNYVPKMEKNKNEE